MIIQRFAFWNPGTWQIPKLYWDAFSDEQRIHAICKQLGKVIAYADYLGINVDDIAERLKAIEEGQLDPIIVAAIEQWFEDNQPAIMTALQNLNDALPISDFDSVNTVKAAIDSLGADVSDLEDKFPITAPDISDDAITTAKIEDDAVTESKIAPEFRKKIKDAIIGNGISAAVEPIYAGDIIAKGQMQSIAVDGDDIWCAFRDGTNFTPCIKRVSRADNEVKTTYSNAALGHANSMTYDPIRNIILVASGSIYALDKALATFMTFPDQPGNVQCLAFDHVTKTLWAMSGLSADPTQTLYKMEQDESEFSLFAVIDNIPGRQDMAVHDDVLFLNDTRANCYVFAIDRDSATIEEIDNATFAKHDTANRWIFMEPEGMTIDSDGLFWLVFGNASATANADGTNSCDGFVCNVPFNGKAIQPAYQSVIDHEVLYFNSTYQDSFQIGPTIIKSLVQCKWMNMSHVRELQYQTSYTDEHAGWLPDKSIHITVNSGVTVDIVNTIQLIGGYIQLRNQGTLVADAVLFNATNRAVTFALRNTGTITLNNTDVLVGFGVFPAVMLVFNKGTMTGTYKFGSTAITGNNTYMIGAQTGSY